MDNKQERTNMNMIASASGKSYKDNKLRVVIDCDGGGQRPGSAGPEKAL